MNTIVTEMYSTGSTVSEIWEEYLGGLTPMEWPTLMSQRNRLRNV
jgi:hypothetical protein